MAVGRARDDSAALGGIVNGYAPLDSGLLIPQTYIPKTGTGVPGQILLEQHTASTSATLDFTSFISSTYDEYIFEYLNMVPATNAQILRMIFGTGGGPSWDTTSGHYSWGYFVSVNNATGTGGSDSDTGISISGGGGSISSTASNAGASGWIRLFSPQSTSVNKAVSAVGNAILTTNSNKWGIWNVSGAFTQTTAVTGIRFQMNSGNITSGIMRVYGIPK